MSPSFSGLNLVFLGPPGSGRHGQARRLADSYCIPHISAGELLRDEVARDTYVGRQARDYMERGELVPDQVMAGLILQRLDREDCRRGFLLNGYPCTVEQAGTLDGILAELGRVIERVLVFEVSDDEIVNRMDANEELVREKLRRYRANAEPLVELYRARGQVLAIDAAGSPELVARAVEQAVGTSVVA